MSVPTYMSTRGTEERLGFREAVLEGLAKDGGLLSPSHLVQVDETLWRSGSDLPSLANRILSLWIGQTIPEKILSALLGDALNFPLALLPLKNGGEWENTYLLELFHGPTLSFKDFGARTMARLVSHFTRNTGEKLTILVATSGDTGSAVADGFAGQDAVQVVLLYPKGKVSPTQELQLVVERKGVLTVAIEGTFDDCQHIVKKAFQDEQLRAVGLSSANSINIGRLLPQMLYYFWAVTNGGFEAPVFCVPSGNLGNLTAGMLAHLSGLPVKRFIAAHNRNDFFPQFISGHGAEIKPSVHTPSSAMDVGAPSNFERLSHLVEHRQLREKIWASSVSDEDTLRTIKKVYDRTGYLADPHTAVGLECVRRYRKDSGDKTPAIVLSTAHPAKFPEVIRRAIGKEPETPKALMELAVRRKQAVTLPASYEAFCRLLQEKLSLTEN